MAASDEAAIEGTVNALAIARIVEPHVRRVVLANPKAVGETSRRAKTDKLDAKLLAQLPRIRCSAGRNPAPKPPGATG